MVSDAPKKIDTSPTRPGMMITSPEFDPLCEEILQDATLSPLRLNKGALTTLQESAEIFLRPYFSGESSFGSKVAK